MLFGTNLVQTNQMVASPVQVVAVCSVPSDVLLDIDERRHSDWLFDFTESMLASSY